MTRCPHCRAANPDAQSLCGSCGRALPPMIAQPWMRFSDLWDSDSAKRSALVALGLLLFRVTLYPWLWQAAGRVEGSVLLFHLCQGLGLGLAVAWVRRPGEPTRRLWIWMALGALGGIFAWAVDYAYNYQHLLYRGVMLAQGFFFGSDGPQVSTFPYALLQVLCAAPPAILLWAYHGTLTRSRPAWSALALLFMTLSLCLHFWSRGAYLQWSVFLPGWMGQWVLHWVALVLICYGTSLRKP